MVKSMVVYQIAFWDGPFSVFTKTVLSPTRDAAKREKPGFTEFDTLQINVLKMQGVITVIKYVYKIHT